MGAGEAGKEGYWTSIPTVTLRSLKNQLLPLQTSHPCTSPARLQGSQCLLDLVPRDAPSSPV